MQSAQAKQVKVTSRGRLHMGFFDLHGGLGRKYGGIGLSLSAPAQTLTVSLDDSWHADHESNARALVIAQQLMAKLNIEGALKLAVDHGLPEHAGLGSGTQLALSVGAAISHLFELNLSTQEIAVLSGRGARSGIGIAAFDHGGLLIDGGRRLKSASSTKVDSPPPLLARYDFPEAWRILLVLDNRQAGVHGEHELAAFDQLPPFPESLAAHLCRQVLMQAMPALLEQDLTAFGQAIQVLQSSVGDYFAPAQGGRYANAEVAAVLQYLAAQGVACFGQSSWGPTGFAVFADAASAEAYLAQLKTKFSKSGLSWLICSGYNRGAQLSLAGNVGGI
ncbi:MAG: GHMP kinase [Methylotenera sp.]|nr:GHMP kinase [Methylotenera sp.]